MRARDACAALLVAALLAALPAAGPAGRAAAQSGGPDLNDLALRWVRGRYASPIVCEIGGQPVRGLRRVVVTPGSRDARPPGGRIIFVDIDAGEAQRCVTALGDDAPNVVGRLEFYLPGRSRPDTASRDFAIALRREGGFAYDVREGQLRIESVGDGSAPRVVDFRGGQARIHQVRPATDAARLLGDLPSPRKLLLELEAPDGTKLRFPLALMAER